MIFAREALIKTREQMMNQINKHKKKINYKIELKIFLNEWNIITARSFKKLNDKMLNSFQIIDSVDLFYKLKLLETMHIHDVFHSELLCSVIDDSLFDQKNEFLKSIVIIIIINSYILVTSIRSTHEKLYAICIEWTKFSEIENYSQSTRLLHAVKTVSFETMSQICSRWLHVRERMF